MSTDFGKRLKAARKHAGLTQAQLATAVKIGQSTVAEAEKSGFGSSHVTQMAMACGVSATWLATGEGEMLDKDVAPARAAKGNSGNVEYGPASKGQVPLISWVKAGSWDSASDPFGPGDAENWYDCPVAHSKSTFVLRVRGDSMTAPHGNTRTYPENCLIFVDPEKRAPSNGDRIIACLVGTDEVTFKVYKNEDGRQWLQPLNPSHEPIREEFKVLGTVLGKWEDG